MEGSGHVLVYEIVYEILRKQDGVHLIGQCSEISVSQTFGIRKFQSSCEDNEQIKCAPRVTRVTAFDHADNSFRKVPLNYTISSPD